MLTARGPDLTSPFNSITRSHTKGGSKKSQDKTTANQEIQDNYRHFPPPLPKK
jgi:hypothetical protein